jgi:DNA-binding NarL/FixJ family response regulator
VTRPRARPVRVLIADDHRLFAEALAAILGSEHGIEVAGVAADGNEAVELSGSLKPDVVLMDISMPGMDGFEAARALTKRKRKPKVVMLTGSNAPQDIARAREAGATSFLTKESIAAELVNAIHEAAGR